MTDKTLTEGEAVRAFWDHLKAHNTVMLGINTPELHTQPMTAMTEPENELIWFFTRTDNSIVQEIAENAEARLVLGSNDHEVYADIIGTMTVEHDRNRIERFWNPMVAAWYPQGKDDPHLVLLCFHPHQGQVWVSKQSAVGMVFAIAKANLTKTTPHVGGSAGVSFRH